MKFEPNKKYTTIAVYSIIVFAICLIMVIMAFRYNGLVENINSFIKVLSPIIWGLVIAYLLNPIMSFFDKHLKSPNWRALKIATIFI